MLKSRGTQNHGLDLRTKSLWSIVFGKLEVQVVIWGPKRPLASYILDLWPKTRGMPETTVSRSLMRIVSVGALVMPVRTEAPTLEVEALKATNFIWKYKGLFGVKHNMAI